jgi:hypothetical protein
MRLPSVPPLITCTADRSPEQPGWRPGVETNPPARHQPTGFGSEQYP